MKAYLQLFRVPNLITAASDVLAAAFVVSGGFSAGDLKKLAALIISSCLLYAGGLALNDVVDYKIDAVERPERPIPAGKITIEHARIIAAGLLCLGLLVSLFSGFTSAGVALLLMISVVTYDIRAKRNAVLGSIMMGLCRGLNFVLGLSVMPSQIPSYTWLAILPFIHIVGVTLLSQGENSSLSRRYVTSLAAFPTVSAILLLIMSLSHHKVGAIFVVMYALLNLFIWLPIVRNVTKDNIRRGVKAGILSLILLESSIAAGYSNFMSGLLVSCLAILSYAVSHWFAMT